MLTSKSLFLTSKSEMLTSKSLFLTSKSEMLTRKSNFLITGVDCQLPGESKTLHSLVPFGGFYNFLRKGRPETHSVRFRAPILYGNPIHRPATATVPQGPKRNARDEFVPDGTHARLVGHDHSATDGKSEEQGQSQPGHLYPEGLHTVVLRRGETHELKDAGRQKDHETYQQPLFAVSSDLGQRLVPHSKAQQAQVHQQHGSANQSQTHQMNARDEWEEPRRTAHRRQQRRILQKTLAMTFRRYSRTEVSSANDRSRRSCGRPGQLSPRV